jgi:Domain of unknown function (DUF6438)
MTVCISLIAGSAACARAAQTLKTNELDTLIVLQRGACERRCAVYKVIIFADGSVVFDGRSYVRRPGLAKTKHQPGDIGQLIDEAVACASLN